MRTTNGAAAHSRVLMLAPAPDEPGGVSAVIRELDQHGLFRRFGVVLIATYEGSTAWSKLRAAARALLKIVATLHRQDISVVHVHSASRASFWRKASLAAICRFAGTRVIFHIHSGEFHTFYKDECGAVAQRIVRYVLRRSDVVVTLTPTSAEIVHEIEPHARIETIANPVSIPDSVKDGIANEVLFLGRLRETKGVHHLIEAAALIRPHITDLSVILAGDGDVAPWLAKAAALGVERHLHFPGWIRGMQKQTYLDRASVFVLPSQFEGMPVGLLEAMAHQLPVVCARVGGITDVVTDGVEGFLVEWGDVAGLADRIQRLLNDRELAEQMGTAGRNRVKMCCDATSIVRQWDALYCRLGASPFATNQ